MEEYNYKEDYDKDYSEKDLLTKFWSYLREHKVKLIAIVILILIGAGLNILPPLMVQKAFDILAAEQNWTVVFPYALAYVLLSFILWVFQVYNGILIIKTSQKVIKDIQVDTFVSLQEQDLSFYDRQSTGKIMSRITNDAQELNEMIGLIGQFISNFVILFAVLIIMFAVNWRLTLVTIAMGPVVIAVGVLFRKIIRKTTGSWRAAIGEVNASFQESVAGIAIAKAFGREKKSKEEFNVINEKTFYYAKKRAFAITGIWPVMNSFFVQFL